VKQVGAKGLLKIAQFGAILGPIGNLGGGSLVLLFGGAKDEVFEGGLRGRSLLRSRIAQFGGICVPVNSGQLSEARSSILALVKVVL
jgi:hypothetical protein